MVGPWEWYDFKELFPYYRASSNQLRTEATVLMYDDEKVPVTNPLTLRDVGPNVVYTILVRNISEKQIISSFLLGAG